MFVWGSQVYVMSNLKWWPRIESDAINIVRNNGYHLVLCCAGINLSSVGIVRLTCRVRVAPLLFRTVQIVPC